MSWNKCLFKDFVKLQRGFDLTKARMKGGEVPVLGSNCTIGYHDEVKVSPPGVITGRSGTLGAVQYVEEPYWPHNTALWVKDFKGNIPKFVYYKLMTLDLARLGSGASVPTLNRNNLDNLPMEVPSSASQQNIASILSTYDDLIENNLKRISLLEESALLLFKEWFINFCFPGCEHTRITKGIPEGWESAYVPEVIDINPREKIEKNKEVWYVPMSSLFENGMTLNKKDFEIRTKHTASKFRNGDVLLARITPCLENGKTGFVQFLHKNELACGSTEFIILRGKLVSPEFTYCLARTYDFRENAIKSMIGSSGRQRVQVACFLEYVVPIPPKSLLDQFNEFAMNNFTQIKVLDDQNYGLKKARDLLLPKLMNGEIAV